MNFPTRVDELARFTVPVREPCCQAWEQAHLAGSDFDEYFFACIRYAPGKERGRADDRLGPAADCVLPVVCGRQGGQATRIVSGRRQGSPHRRLSRQRQVSGPLR
jgi:hypothetical protein